MRISDWSSDVCSSDLLAADVEFEVAVGVGLQLITEQVRLGNVAERFVQARNVGARLRLRAPPLHGEVQKARRALEIGRASCRERGCQYVYISVVAVLLKNKNKEKTHNHI